MRIGAQAKNWTFADRETSDWLQEPRKEAHLYLGLDPMS
jgi:hypothetical protein